MADTCVFCEIATGRIPVHSAYEDDDVIAFVDHEPIRPGHLLVMTKKHYPYFDDLPPQLLGHVCRLAQRLAKIQRRLFRVERAGLMFSGNDVSHCHAHIVPLHENTDFTSGRYFPDSELVFRRRPKATEAEMSRAAEEIARLL